MKQESSFVKPLTGFKLQGTKKIKIKNKLKRDINDSIKSIRQKARLLKDEAAITSEFVTLNTKPITEAIHDSTKKSIDTIAKPLNLFLKKQNTIAVSKKKAKSSHDETSTLDISAEESDEGEEMEEEDYMTSSDNEEGQSKEAKSAVDNVDTGVKKTPKIAAMPYIVDQGSASSNKGKDFAAKLLPRLDDELKPYVEKFLTGNTESIDRVYGIRFNGHHWTIGNSKIEFKNKNILINDEQFPGTKGLYELLFLATPELNVITDDDYKSYKKILEITNAHRKTYSDLKPVASNRGFKYMNIIRKIFPPQAKLGTSMSALLPIYEYYDDVNELVDRLKLLYSSSVAGNDSHINEIASIIEEMKEVGVIA